MQDGTNASVANQYESQRKLGKRASRGPIIKKLKDMTDNCIPAAPLRRRRQRIPTTSVRVHPGRRRDPPRHHLRGLPGILRPGDSKFAQKVRGDR